MMPTLRALPRLSTTFFLLAASAAALVACGEAGEGPALEAEGATGISYGREDAAGIAPNTPDGDAILAFANQPLSDRGAAQGFRAALESELHELPAGAIYDFRVGADGEAGTLDDATFSDLIAIDALPYTGAEVFEGLLKLAKAQGFYVDAGIECVGVTEQVYLNGRGFPAITSHEQMRRVHESGCNAFSGDLLIKVETDGGVPEARTLEALAGLRRVGGTLTIRGSHALSGLSGLRGLKQVQGLTVYDNANLASLDGLQGITSLRGALWIANNPALTSLKGLEGLQITGILSIEEMPQLTDLRGLDGLTRVDENFEIEENPALTSLQGLGRLAEVGGDLILQGNEALADMTGLSALSRVGGALRSERGLYEVTGFGGLTSLKSVGTLELGPDNPQTLEGLQALEQVEADLSISDSDIDSLAPLANLRELDSLYLADNRYLQFGDVFASLQSAGRISIENNDNQDTITGFNALITLRETLSIGGNTTANLDGFHNLQEAGSIILWLSPAMTRLGAFTSLRASSSTIRIQGAGLTDLSSLNALELSGDLTLLTYSTSLQGLAGLQSVDGDFNVTGAPNLGSLDNFAALTSVSGDVIVDVNLPQAALERFLGQLTHVGGSVQQN